MTEPNQEQFEAPKTEFCFVMAGYSVRFWAKNERWNYRISNVMFDDPVEVHGFIDRRTAIGDAYLHCIGVELPLPQGQRIPNSSNQLAYINTMY